MTTLVKFNNNLPVFNSFFDDFLRRDLHTGFAHGKVAVNVKENTESYILEVVAPGFKKEDFSIAIENQHLKINAKVEAVKTESTEEKYTIKEYQRASFEKTYKLPNEVEADKITAKYEDGILNLQIPKKTKEEEKVVKNISIG